jgi:translation initiation factor IF-3
LRYANDLEDYGKVENLPVLEGKRMIIMVAPIKKKLASNPSKTKSSSTDSSAKKAGDDSNNNEQE